MYLLVSVCEYLFFFFPNCTFVKITLYDCHRSHRQVNCLDSNFEDYHTLCGLFSKLFAMGMRYVITHTFNIPTLKTNICVCWEKKKKTFDSSLFIIDFSLFIWYVVPRNVEAGANNRSYRLVRYLIVLFLLVRRTTASLNIYP